MTRSAKQIFEEVCELQPAKRETVLSELCGGDTKIRVEVDSLLNAHDSAGEFLNEPTIDFDGQVAIVATENEVAIAEGPGSVVDRYKLLEKIGEGGFGIVYMAQQSEPIRRRVAVKIIKLGMDTKQVVARFEAERQALAMLDHPNIARVIDAGSTETGRPFFVMELVRGDPITKFCDQKRLPLQERLELFQQVCRAIEHAHQKGIIHRDIKPSNVLVTVANDKPLVKVIDFGIAKATNCELTEKTLFTEFRQLIGTPLYMSPEQAERSGVDVDTRTDIYSLGVLLYEMLTGHTPLDPKKLNSVALGELQRMIVEDEPTKPSAMVTTTIGDLSEVAKHRGTEASRLGNLLRGDLDWIVLKAIEKDRSRRYDTATHFVADIDRFLNDEAVEASPPSKMYQLRKFARRNRGLIATAATVLAALVVGLIATGAAATWAIHERSLAEEARDQAEQEVKNAQNAATLAAASLMLPERQALSYAKSWLARINKMRADRAKPEEILRAEAQYAAWWSGWLMANGRNAEAKQIIDHTYSAARELVGTSDPTFLALCNARIRVNAAVGADANRNADTFSDLIEALQKIHGSDRATQLLPEYASALAAAGRNDKAADAISQYLAFHKERGTKLTPTDNLRLDISIDQLVQWGHTHPELMKELMSLRETGSVTEANASIDNDPELKKDLATLQGTWRYQKWEKGKVVVTVVQRFEGNKSHSKVIGDSDPGYGREGRIELTRNGGVKVMNVYLGGSLTPTVSFVYQLKPHRLFLVDGFLTNRPIPKDIEMNTFYRITEEEAETLIQNNG